MSEQITQELLDATARIAPATVGHFIEQGVVDPEIRAIVRPAGFVGRAATVRTVVPDSALVHHAVSSLQRHDVLVIDCGGARRHAPVGEVVALAAQVREAAAIVIDGPCTDALELQEIGLPVFARGLTPLTTKLLALDGGAIGEPVSCGGAVVAPGDLVLGDENGVICIPPARVRGLLELAEADEAEEGPVKDAIRRGGALNELSGVRELLSRKATP